MKKTYMAPAAQVVTFDAMTMLAASGPEIKMNSAETDAAASFSEGKGWNSEAWADED